MNRKQTSIWLGAFFVLFSLLIYLPGAIYFSNLNEFSLRTLDLVVIFVPATFVSLIVAALAIFILPYSVRNHLVSLCFGLGLVFWLQGNIFVWQYGPLDGSDIDWSLFTRNGVIDSTVWLVFLAISLRWPKKFVEICRPVAVLIIAIQSVMLIISAGTAQSTSSEASARNYTIDNSDKYSFAKERNVILIVLDAFQSDIFSEIVSETPEYAEFFEGFTYFRDAVAGSNYTELAIPALLTGRMFDNSRPREEFLREAFLEYGLTTNLKRKGYDVDIYPWLGWGNESIYFDDDIASNLSKADRSVVSEPTFTEKKAKEALHLLDLSLFRAAPHFLKRYIHNDQKWFVAYIATYLLPEGVKQIVGSDDQFEIRAFVENTPQLLDTNRGDWACKYYHLKGAHAPLTVNENREFTNEIFAFNKRNYVLQAQANLSSLHDFLEKLQQSNIYDSSLIIVLGDHGSGNSPELYMEPSGTSREPLRIEGSKRNFRRDKARAIPLVLIKKIDATGPLAMSNAPVSLMDIPATIYAELGLPKISDRPSMFEVDTTVERTRYHSAFEFNPNKTGYVDEITVYEINGDSWLNESWKVDEIRSATRSNTIE